MMKTTRSSSVTKQHKPTFQVNKVYGQDAFGKLKVKISLSAGLGEIFISEGCKVFKYMKNIV